jgi:repressor LexA
MVYWIMEHDLTKKQNQMLQFIERHCESNGYPPTILEIGGYFKITIGTVQDHLEALRRKGYLKQRPKTARGLELVHKPDQIPVYGRVAAGHPVFAEEHVEGMLEGVRGRSGELFALRVHGESMIGAGIHEGDIVIVKKQKTAENGDIVVALLGMETTIKRYRAKNNQHVLEPANPDYPVISDIEFEIIGKVIELRRVF